jgi:hypothetical protein
MKPKPFGPPAQTLSLPMTDLEAKVYQASQWGRRLSSLLAELEKQAGISKGSGAIGNWRHRPKS